ncbi:MAG: hypothetical protein MRZ53_08145 [Oscillospiraceae bacterium]|nr:hypothetical protein [Oscillospiraceae bacterium]
MMHRSQRACHSVSHCACSAVPASAALLFAARFYACCFFCGLIRFFGYFYNPASVFSRKGRMQRQCYQTTA